MISTLSIGGAERFAIDLAVAQRTAGLDAHVIAMDAAGPLLQVARDGGVPCHVIERRVRHDPLAWSSLIRVLRQLGPDIAHLHDFSPIVRAAPAARLAGIPLIVGLVHQVRSLGWRDRLFAAAVRLLDVLVVSSQAVRIYLESAFSLSNAPVVPCGINLRRFTYRTPAADVAPHVLSVGRLIDQKGHDVLIDAFARVVRQRPAATLTIMGDGPLRPALEHQVRSLGLEDQVRLPGSCLDTAPWLAAADVFCFPSRWEPQGLAVLEAQASGVPVIASAVDGILETTANGEAGLLVPPDDPAALARAIDRLSDRVADRCRLAEAARVRLDRWSIETIADSYAPIYNAGRSRAPGRGRLQPAWKGRLKSAPTKHTRQL